MKSYNFSKDIKTIREIFGMSLDAFAECVNIARSNLIQYEQKQISPHKDALEKIYSYAYDNDLNINKAKEMLYEDRKENNILLFHGAKDAIVGDINSSHINGQKDFGPGFYLGESLDSATSWVADRENGSCYCFYFSKDNNLKYLHFEVNRDWMYAILYFRGAFDKYSLTDEVKEIIKKVNECDYLIAPIADNNMYGILNDFAYDNITDEQCLHALSANNLGLQYVFKTQKACNALKMIDRLYLCGKEKEQYLLKRKELAEQGKSKVSFAIHEYRRKGKYFDELFKKNE